MPSLVVLFNLKDEASREAYEKWAQTTDVPTVKGLSSIDDFKVYRTTGMLGSEEKPPYQYCEVIEVNDMDEFGKEVATETMQKVAAEFQDFADGPMFLLSEQFA